MKHKTLIKGKTAQLELCKDAPPPIFWKEMIMSELPEKINRQLKNLLTLAAFCDFIEDGKKGPQAAEDLLTTEKELRKEIAALQASHDELVKALEEIDKANKETIGRMEWDALICVMSDMIEIAHQALQKARKV